MAKKRPNVIPIIEDARHPQKYRMLVPMVDVIFAGTAANAPHQLNCSACVFVPYLHVPVHAPTASLPLVTVNSLPGTGFGYIDS